MAGADLRLAPGLINGTSMYVLHASRAAAGTGDALLRSKTVSTSTMATEELPNIAYCYLQAHLTASGLKPIWCCTVQKHVSESNSKYSVPKTALKGLSCNTCQKSTVGVQWRYTAPRVRT